MAALSRFISKPGEKGLPFFKLLKKADKFVWDDEASKVLEELKADQETLYLYISATTHVVSTVLVVERQEPGHAYAVQRPVYYVSKVLSDSKTRYTQVQKLLYVVLISSRNLHHYFQAHKIFVVSSFPIDSANFMAEWTEIQKPPSPKKPEHWTMYYDGALNLEGAGVGVHFISPKGEQLNYVLQIHCKTTNNGAECEALIHGLRIVVSLGIKRILTYSDSKVVIQQVNKNWDCAKDSMDAYCAENHKLEAHFNGLEFHHVPMDHNVTANILSKLSSKRA
ncbi:uncharacterized protein [Setaria viridis]|uniref:uncharacterized protein n=1 Tax=Setaria viridis TaxID=4556 RepID=UPI003B3B3939